VAKNKKLKPIVKAKKGKVEGRIARKNQKQPLAYPIPKSKDEKKSAPRATDRGTI